MSGTVILYPFVGLPLQRAVVPLLGLTSSMRPHDDWITLKLNDKAPRIQRMSFSRAPEIHTEENRSGRSKFWTHLKAHSVLCCGEYLESLETKLKWFTQGPKAENYNQLKPSLSV